MPLAITSDSTNLREERRRNPAVVAPWQGEDQTAGPPAVSSQKKPQTPFRIAVHDAHTFRAWQEQHELLQDAARRRASFFAFWEQLEGASYDEMPSARAESAMLDLLWSVASKIFIPAGELYADEAHGLRAEWEIGSRQLRLVVHASETKEDYLYWQDDEQTGEARYGLSATGDEVTSRHLLDRLKWLSNETK
jgi:hypothetical protein